MTLYLTLGGLDDHVETILWWPQERTKTLLACHLLPAVAGMEMGDLALHLDLLSSLYC